MKLTWIAGASVATLLAMIPGHRARANTYYCDNDRDLSQYPNCSNRQDDPITNTSNSGWSYRSGLSGDWNGDDRLSYSSSSFPAYFWTFSGLTGGNAVDLQVWLANAAFTDPSAGYRVKLADDNCGASINQNTAPSGWSFLVECPGNVGTASISVVSEPNVQTGADIVQVLTVNRFAAAPPVEAATSSRMGGIAAEEIVDPSSCGVDTAMDASVNTIQQRMLNAIDHYRDVKGSYRIVFQNNDQDDTVAFEISESTPGSYVKTTSRSGAVREHRSDGSQLEISYPATGALLVARVSRATPPIGPRQYFNSHCEAVFVHRQDPASAPSASDVALPQNYAFWLSDSGARVVASDVILGRQTTVIEGRHTDYLATKLGATAFKMWVDDETGTLLKLTGTDERGAVVYFVEVDAIQFNAGVDLPSMLGRYFDLVAVTDPEGSLVREEQAASERVVGDQIF